MLNRLGLDKRSADAEGTRAGAQKVGCRFQVDTAGGHEADLGQGGTEGLEVRRAAQIGREDLDDIGPGLPGSDNLRGRQRARHDQFIVSSAQADDVKINGWGDDELRAGQ